MRGSKKKGVASQPSHGSNKVSDAESISVLHMVSCRNSGMAEVRTQARVSKRKPRLHAHRTEASVACS